jgi:ABC transporter DrrB family efflux protein
VTATTAPLTAPLDEEAPVSNRLPRGAALSDASVIAGRNIKHLLRTPQLLVASVAQTVMFLLLFRYVFGGSIQIPDMTFVDYLIPGYLATIAIFDGFGVSIFFAEDSKSGLIERFRALPMARSAVVGGRAIADLLRQAALLAITTLVGIAVGFRFAGSFGGIVLAFVIALVWGFALFWVFAAIGLFVRDAETAQAASTPFFILVFVSSAIIDVNTLPGWLQPFARNQPLSQVCNAMRGLMDGGAGAALVEHSTSHYVLTSFIWCAAITAVFAPLAIYAYRRP